MIRRLMAPMRQRPSRMRFVARRPDRTGPPESRADKLVAKLPVGLFLRLFS